MENFVDFINASVGVIADCDKISISEDGYLSRSLVKNYWLKEEFKKYNYNLVLILGVDTYTKKGTAVKGITETVYSHILFDDISNGCEDKYGTLDYSFKTLCNKFGKNNFMEGVSKESFVKFCENYISSVEELNQIIGKELYDKAEELINKLDFGRDDIKSTLELLNALGKDAPNTTQCFRPILTLTECESIVNNSEIKTVLCPAIDTLFTKTPISNIIDFTMDNVSLGSLVATPWVAKVLDLTTDECNPLLTVVQLLAYVSYIMLDMTKTMSKNFDDK